MPVWIKDTLVDLISLTLVVIYSITQNNVIEIVLWIYTALLLIGKILYFTFPYLKKKAQNSRVPDSFYHLIYFITVIALIFSTNFYLTAVWAIIWILSSLPKVLDSNSK